MDFDIAMDVSTVILTAKPSSDCLIGLALRQAVCKAEAEDNLFNNVTRYPARYHGSLKVPHHAESFPGDTFCARQYRIAEERTPRTIRLNR